MKKILLPVAAFALLLACNSGDSKEEGKKEEGKTEEKKETVNDVSANPDYEKGLALVAKSDCLTCHKVDEAVTGPSYRDVANKYAGNTSDTVVSYLAGKIIKGGNGVWGEAFMTPHAGVTKEDAEAMAKYVLLLKK